MSYAETIGRVMGGSFDEVSEAEKTETIRELIQVCSVAASAVALQPFPLLDMAFLAPIQIGMVQSIGRVHGYALDRKSVLEILSTFGASIVAQNVTMAAAKLIPFLGWAASASMAYALTYAIGEVSHQYFKEGRGIAPEDLKTMFEKIYKRTRAEKDAAQRKNGSLKARLDQLVEAYKSGLLTEEEFRVKKEALLAEL